MNSSCPCDAPTRFDTCFRVIKDPGTHFGDSEGWLVFEKNCEGYMVDHDMYVGAFEFSFHGKDVDHVMPTYYVYDVNANTNYSDHAEKKIGYDERGMVNQARMLIRFASKPVGGCLIE